jgi:DNA-binding CsgD family transcriptional regulator/tetratricopeptide (TPR) repeat protein
MPVSWPLVGRSEELAFVVDALEGSRGVILAGAAGVGKSRLAKESMALTRSRGFAMSWAIGSSSAASLPFGALAHLLPEEIPVSPDRGNILRAAADAIIERSGTGRFVLGVDDAHLLDDQSAALIQHLALTDRAFLLLTVRSGEPAPDALVGLWKDETCDWLELQPLSREETEELLESALGSQVEEGTTHRLWEITRGNPLYLRELVSAALADGSLQSTGGLWRWRGRGGHGGRLRGILGSRLEGLALEDRELLEVVTLGDPLELGIAQSLASPQTIGRLEALGLLEETKQRRRATIRLSHPLYGEILRPEITPARARDVHKALAEALQATGARRNEDLLRLAAWHLEGGIPGLPGLFQEAAGRAAALFDYPLAERLARAAVEADGGTGASLLLASAVIAQGRFEEGEDLLALVAGQAADDTTRVEVALIRSNNLHHDLGRTDAALDVIAEAEQTVSDRGLLDQLEAGRATYLLTAARVGEALKAGLRILQRPTASDRAVAGGIDSAGIALIYSGRPEEALDVLDRHLDQILRVIHRWPYGEVAPATYRTLAHFFSGSLVEGAELAEHAHREAVERGTDWAVGWTAGLFGGILAAQGRVRYAARLLSEAHVLLAETNLAGQLPVYLANLAYSLALGGDMAGAEQALGKAEAALSSGHELLEAWLALPRVWVPACRGEVSAAIATALDEAERLGSIGVLSLQAVALHDVARLGEPRRVVDELSRVAASCDGRLIPAFARHADALAGEDLTNVKEVSDDFESMGAFLLAAEAAAEVSVLHRVAGSERAAVRMASRARDLAALCEGARTPALALIEDSHHLTRREQEVATLAARGLSNGDIAERLMVSVRTVENHLHRAFTKLGVESRRELGAVLGVERIVGDNPRPTESTV